MLLMRLAQTNALHWTEIALRQILPKTDFADLNPFGSLGPLLYNVILRLRYSSPNNLVIIYPVSVSKL